ncbi:MAG: nicotinate-nucleotide--dimethylbenzimidazole phosphoribosyltransferase [Coriobacteriales bacterium]|nr:nicotinate-nucleotide--dimethylbenzimidazole phosphoribosyltransferase [Coriobacteriaceae bacterium]MDY2722922.1 nicotinate-nucleotide--dimethylbenzimidazole phosphoribosyltransferase [Coriobacteriales bacterium]
MIDFQALNAQLAPFDEAAARRAVDKWNAVAKPIASLGKLEDIVVQLAGISGSEDVDISKRVVVVMCADNGVVAQGVTQCGSEVTTIIADSVARGRSSVCSMCRPVHIDTLSVDMGMAKAPSEPGVLDRCIARGTGDISVGPAMTREQACQAIQVGIDLVGDLKAQGYRLIATGEMGIGNTTTSSAVASVLLGLPVEQVTGKGAGLSDEGLERKVSAIKRAIAVNGPDSHDALDVLAKLGGFDIAGLVGLFVGGAVHRVPIVIDGFISILAAYVAAQLCPACAQTMVPSHISTEPATRMLAERLGVEPIIHAGMHLGEGTGAVCLVPLLDMALSLYDGSTFDSSGIDAYEVDPQ